jgi:hypothetical protein
MIKFTSAPFAIAILSACGESSPPSTGNQSSGADLHAVVAAATSVSKPESASRVGQAPVVEATTDSGWLVTETTDSFTNEKHHFASNKSLNSVDFHFPYQGLQHATLVYHPVKEGSELLPQFQLVVERGQFLCNKWGDGKSCPIYLKFENTKIVQWPAASVRDGTTNRLNLIGYIGTPSWIAKTAGGLTCLAAKLLTTKSLAIKAEFYGDGDTVFEFNVDGFNDLPFLKSSADQLKVCQRHERELEL